MSQITLIDAINQALAFEMAADKDVLILGEDIGVNGGVFRATVGLLEKFGRDRVLDTPIAEAMLGGVSIGMAAQGLKPVTEFQFSGFIYPAFNHIVNHASRLRNRTRGRLHCPVVFRAPYGGGIHAPEHHSESPEAFFAHIPGLRVVIPSSPLRAYGLLLASIRSPDPVVFLEPKRIYRLGKQDVADNGEALPLDKCFINRNGDDITLVSWGAMMHETMQAAKQLEQQGISAEVIDLATIKPIDMETIMASVEKTGRCVVIHEACYTGGVGADISAMLAERGLDVLLAPVQRVTAPDTVVPYLRLEKHFLPSVEQIILAAQTALEYA